MSTVKSRSPSSRRAILPWSSRHHKSEIVVAVNLDCDTFVLFPQRLSHSGLYDPF
jgi:hypothetical protein